MVQITGERAAKLRLYLPLPDPRPVLSITDMQAWCAQAKPFTVLISFSPTPLRRYW